MQPINSGTTRERIVRTTLPLLFVTILAIAFLWDGYVGYATENAENVIGSLGLTGTVEPSFNRELTADVGRDVAAAIKPGQPYSQITQRLGSPAFEHGGYAYFLGPGGHLQARQERDHVASIEWLDGAKSDMDLTVQRWLGYFLTVMGLGFILQLVRVLTTRATLSDDGLSLRGQPTIPLDAMKGISAATVGAEGVCTLAYTSGGRDRTVNLDPYKLKECSAIVAAICKHIGCANPIEKKDDTPDRACCGPATGAPTENVASPLVGDEEPH